ncbi:MAG: LPS-assembly protein LptD [Magnetococcales bacterium]|nr:LPS-assembly protein LptD [Magnetococcales bacterium]
MATRDTMISRWDDTLMHALRCLYRTGLKRCSPKKQWLGILWLSLLLAAWPVARPGWGEESPPLEVEADQLEQDQASSRVLATGHVRLKQTDKFLLEANQLSYNPQTRKMRADGQVHLQRSGDQFFGSHLQFEQNTARGLLEKAVIDMKGPGGHATAEKVVLHDKDNLILYDASYTNCDCDKPPWYLKSDQIEVNRPDNEATARNVTLFLHDLPVAYTPWWSQPVQNIRQNGFLTPSLRVSSANGLELDVPYYLNLAPERDATLTLHPTSNRGVLGKVQYRYMGVGYHGEIETHDIYDTKREEFRGLTVFDHFHQWDDWRFKARLEQTQSRDFINDFEQKLVENTNRHLDSNVQLDRLWSRERAFTGVETGVRWFQDLQAPNDRQTVQQLPYARLVDERPLPQWGSGWRMGSVVRFDNFYQLTGDLTNRVDLAPTLNHVRSLSIGQLHTRLGVRETLYQVSDNPIQAGGRADGSAHREASLVNVRLNSHLQRTYSRQEWPTLLLATLKHTVEPSVQYTVNAVQGQSDVPNYDSRASISNNDPVLREFSTSNLFATNLYPGIDRISSGHWLTYGVTNRFLGRQTEKAQVREVANLTVGQRYAPAGERDYQKGHSFSDVVSSLNVFLSDQWSVTTATRFDPYAATFMATDAAVSYTTPHKDKYDVGFNLNRQETSETIKDATLGARIGLTDGWRWSQKVNYSLEQRDVKNWRSGLTYEHDCWSLELIAGRRLSSSTVDHGGGFAGFLINFKGLGGYGVN